MTLSPSRIRFERELTVVITSDDASPAGWTGSLIVSPAKAGIQLHRAKLDPDFRQGDEQNDLTKFLVESSHSSPCSMKEALSGCRLLSVEKGPVPVGKPWTGCR
jgi:hypothetical protein